MSEQRTLVSADDMLAWALAVEQEAAERYAELADQMEVHNNHEVAELFRKLAAIEAKHVANVESMSGGRKLPPVSLWESPWESAESPEAVAHDDVHYLMTPHHALSLALEAERRAVSFFARIAETAEDADVRRTASQLRDEEQHHAALVEEWLGRYPPPREDWDEDFDPPATHE